MLIVDGVIYQPQKLCNCSSNLAKLGTIAKPSKQALDGRTAIATGQQ